MKQNRAYINRKKDCKNLCKRCFKGVDFSKKEMYGSFLSTKKWKDMKLKRVLINIGGFAFLLLLLKVFYDFQPDHFQLKLPCEEDLQLNPSLRSMTTLTEHYHTREHIYNILEKYCNSQKEFDILFCHNVRLNNVPIFSPCFMICGEISTFYYDIEILETDIKEQVTCIESYSTFKKKMVRNKNILIRGKRHMDLQEFSMFPNKTIDSCIYQHANDVSRGEWIQN